MLNGHHHVRDVPVVLLGRGSGRFQTGGVLNDKDESHRQMCRL